MVEDLSSSSESDSPRHEITYDSKPKKKWFRHLETVIEQKWKEGLKKSTSLPPGRA